MKSRKPERNEVTGIGVGKCICSECRHRIYNTFLSCAKRVSITNDIVLGNKDCQYFEIVEHNSSKTLSEQA